MEIPLDFFLRLMKGLSDDLELEDVSKKIKKHYQMEEEDFGDVLDDVTLKDIIMFYISSNKAFKKNLRKKIKSIEANQDEKKDDEEEEEEIKPKKTKKNELLSKKQRREEKEEDEEEKPKKKKKKQEDDEDIDFDKLAFAPRPKSSSNPDRVPFQRIDKSIIEKIPPALKDNSYEYYSKKTGDSYGKFANEKLKVTRGKDFKKEKTKFKNKTSAGGLQISQDVRSIKLDDDSD